MATSQQTDDPRVRVWSVTLLSVGLVVGSIPLGGVWGPLFGWRWTCATLVLGSTVAYQWFRLLRKQPVNPPASGPDATTESN